MATFIANKILCDLAKRLALALAYELCFHDEMSPSAEILEEARDLLEIQDELADVDGLSHPLDGLGRAGGKE